MSDFILSAVDTLLTKLKRSKKRYLFLPHSSPQISLPQNKIEEKKAKPPAVEKKPSPPKNKELELQPLKAHVVDDMKDIKDLFLSKFPHIMVYDTPLNDSYARKVKNTWKTHITLSPLIVLYNDPSHKVFLENVAKAISYFFLPTKALSTSYFDEKSKVQQLTEDPQLKAILAPKTVIDTPSLTPYFKELPQQNKRYLDKIPLIFLPDISLYFTHPEHKASLWKFLCKQIQTITNSSI